MPTISVCMIVKNESTVLARCLDSLKGLYDELIIVDTGSTDNTMEIAADYTDKIYTFEWTGSFSDARNYSFSLAKMDYIYCADADEVIDEENRRKFLSLKNSLSEEIEIVQMIYSNQLSFNTTYNFDAEPRPKLYKRLRSFVWENAVHEAVRMSPVVYDSDIVIIHMPQSLHSKRDFSIYNRITQRERLSEHLYMMYARELYISGTDEDFLGAYEYFRSSVRNESRSPDNLKQGLCIVARAAYLAGDHSGMFSAALKNLSDGHGSSEVCCTLGDHYFAKGDIEEAYIWYYNAAYEASPELSLKHGGEYPLERLAECCRLSGNEAAAEEFISEIEKRQQLCTK